MRYGDGEAGVYILVATGKVGCQELCLLSLGGSESASQRQGGAPEVGRYIVEMSTELTKALKERHRDGFFYFVGEDSGTV